MRDTAAPPMEQAIASSRTMIEASRHHLAGIMRRRRDDRACAEAMRRDLDRWRRELRRWGDSPGEASGRTTAPSALGTGSGEAV